MNNQSLSIFFKIQHSYGERNVGSYEVAIDCAKHLAHLVNMYSLKFLSNYSRYLSTKKCQ